jgi:transposase, IS30 family
MIPDLDEPAGRQLSLAEREEIAHGWSAGLGKAEIARRLGRHRSTIGRELERNQTVRYPKRQPRPDGLLWERGPEPGTNRGQDRPQHERLRYRAALAQSKAEARARRPKLTKLAGNPELATRVQTELKELWSPEQIAGMLRRDFPDRPEMWVSHETIYQELYVQGRGQLRRELTRCLRTGRALRRPRRLPDQRRERRIRDKVMISERPAEAEDRAVPGHGEGDLIIGRKNLSAIGTLVERTTNYTMLLHLPDGYTPELVRDGLAAKIKTLPDVLRASLTWDQGPEMGKWKQVAIDADIDIYFCDPHAPWQRATNENTNGLLRQYFPKSSDLSAHSIDDLDWVAAELNDRPRKRLGFKKPIEQIGSLLLR